MDRATSQFLHYRTSGDLAALSAVFDLLAPRLLSLALHLCRHAADAEDLVQATFVVAMQKAAQFEPGREVAPWLGGILAGEARNLARRRQRRGEPLGERIDAAPMPAELAERRELVQQLRTHITALPDEQRQALLLQLEHGLQPAEIGEVLGVPAGTVRVRVHRGLRALRKLLPASLATMLLGQLAPRGLAAVRQAVLREALAAAVGGVAAGTGVAIAGVVVMKQVLAVVAMVVLGCATWWAMSPSAATPSAAGMAPAAPPPRAAAASSSAASAASPASPAAAPIERRELPDTGGLRVEVGWDSGGPVADIAIAVWPDVAAELRPPQLLAFARTGADGTAHFADLPAGPVVLDVQPDGDPTIFAKPVLRATVPPGGEAVFTRSLASTGPLHGCTVDDTGTPIADAEVFASTSGAVLGMAGVGDASASLPTDGWRCIGRSGVDGSFVLPLVKGEYVVGAAAPDHAAAGTQRVRDAAAGVTLVLTREHGRVAGTVTDDGGAVAGARVQIHAADVQDRRLPDGTEVSAYAPMLTQTAGDGTFTLPGLGVGEHVLRIEAPGHAPATQRLTVSGGRTLALRIALQRQATLAVSVRDADGAPVPAANLAVWCGDVEARHPTHETKTRADGTCALVQLPPGELRVQATRFGTGRASATLILREGETRACELRLQPRVGIRGRLVDHHGAPVAGGTITATDETWTMSDFRDRPQEPFGARTDDDGSFVLRDLGPYPFRLQARAPGAEDVVLLAEHVEPGPDLATFTLPAHKSTATVSGVVLGPDGRPCAGARIGPWRRGEHSARGVLTDARGRFELTALDPGSYTVQVSVDGLLGLPTEPFELAFDEHRDLGALRLQRGATLTVRVLDGDGRPWQAEDPWPWFVDADEQVHSGKPRPGSIVTFGPLPAGRGRLCVSLDNLVAWPLEVPLTDGQEARADLRVMVGTMRRLRFERAPQAQATTLRGRITDAAGRELRRLAVPWPADQPAVETRVALLPGEWNVTAADDAGSRFAGALEVTDGSADDSPQIIAPVK